ncbi:hypothetical protein BN1723_005898 [Verticillium longisporum]|uniref:Uncharacterized protein n=1 Tax=Verticillium longisporum TaxID=100787 RepID=A0A0G4NBW6_VERLO|nr:hypothetical protein BN1723_005898 [Verticillium longisporum]
MGLFSRKEKVPRVTANAKPSINTSDVSVHSGASSLKSPPGTTRGGFGRVSGGNTNPNTPLTPFSPVSIPKIDLPRPPDPQLDPAGYLRSLGAVRERSRIVTDKALRNELNHFDVDLNKFPDVVSFVSCIIKRDFDAPFTSIPSHGRHQHFCVGGRDRIAHLLSTFPDDIDNTEKCRRMIPVPSLENGGLLWFNDLSVSDPFFILPVAAPIAMIAMLKSGTKFAPVQQQAQMKLMMYIFVPLSLIFTIWLPAAVQFYFLCSTLVGWGQNLLFQNPAFRRATGLPELVRPVLPASTSRISGAMFYPPTKRTGSTDANTIDVTAVEEKPKNVFSGAVADLKQTVHGAKGGMGSFVDQARQEQAEKSNKSWEEKRAEEDKRRFKADLKRRAK